MIISTDEYDELAEYVESRLTTRGFEFFASRPHLLMPLGFDQYRCVPNNTNFPEPWHGRNSDNGPHSFYRKPTGQWSWMFGVYPGVGCLTFGVAGGPFSADMDPDRVQLSGQLVPMSVLLGRADLGVQNVDIQDLLDRVRSVVSNPHQMNVSTVWSGRLWTPEAQHEQERAILANGAADLLQALRSDAITLADLSWRQLEDIVVEILRRGNFEIHKVTESPQGGRDVIARHWVLGEPLTLAVEVKHRDVVEPGHVRDAMYANQHFNGLLFVTSGRFSSGVLRERHGLGNQLRLILKDGVALRDWIRSYPMVSPVP